MHLKESVPTAQELEVRTLGPAEYPSPLRLSVLPDDLVPDFVSDGIRISLDVEFRAQDAANGAVKLGFEKAGPRQKLFFDASKLRAGIVTCGGLCPGTNNVLRSLVLELHHGYRVHEVLGFRYGYDGIAHYRDLRPEVLTPDAVRSIHRLGGTVLGSSRGAQDPVEMVNALMELGIDVLFTIGGDGTLRGAHAIAQEITRRNLPISIIGIPKTIDNDLRFMDKTFGFDTAVEAARVAVDAAHAEALGARNGIGLVKLMGRDAGFIACAAALASREVNFCLVPEVPFSLEGPRGLLSVLEKRLQARGHALIVVAEGCAASVAGANITKDESGNARYTTDNADVGPLLRSAIQSHLKNVGMSFSLKYIDPSYGIRGIPANAADSIFCDMLARHAAHAGLAGRTDVVVGRWNGRFTHVPIPLATSHRNRLNPDGALWLAVTEATGQPVFHGPDKLVP